MGSSQSRKTNAKLVKSTNDDVPASMVEGMVEDMVEGMVNDDIKEPEISYISDVPAKYSDGNSSLETTYSGNVTGTRNNYVMNGFGILNFKKGHSISGIFRNNELEICISVQMSGIPILECEKFYANNPDKNVYKLFIFKLTGSTSMGPTGYSIIGKFKFQLSDLEMCEKSFGRWILNTKLITYGLCDVFYKGKKLYEIEIENNISDLIIGKEYDSDGRIVFDGYFKSNFYTDNVFAKQGEAKIYSYNNGQCVVRKAIYDKGKCIVVMIDDEPNDTSEASAPVIE